MTSDQISIRPAVAADAEAIAHLYEELHAAEWHGSPPFPIAYEAFLDEVRTVLASDTTRVVVATNGGTLIGTARVELAARPYGPIAEIRRVVVTAAFRQRGVATRLMAAAEEAALALGTGNLRLSVVSGNQDARRLYERLGYEEFAIRYRKRLDDPG
jgi:ribosomal protein S18 acetylase RimI-like enzyme